MLSTRIIPCLDIKDLRVVKGVQFLNLKDAGDPILAAQHYAREGADELCFLDITASVDKREIMLDLVQKVAEQISIPFTVGGGLRTIKDIESVLHSGADKVSLNTAAFQNPEILDQAAKIFGSQCIVCAIDAKRNSRTNNFEVHLNGGRSPSDRDAVSWAIEATARGAGEILLTSMDRDGTGKGYDLELLAAVRKSVSVPIIASGGVGSPDDICEVIELGYADAVLAASIFHFKKYSIPMVKEMMIDRGLKVRPHIPSNGL